MKGEGGRLTKVIGYKLWGRTEGKLEGKRGRLVEVIEYKLDMRTGRFFTVKMCD